MRALFKLGCIEEPSGTTQMKRAAYGTRVDVFIRNRGQSSEGRWPKLCETRTRPEPMN